MDFFQQAVDELRQVGFNPYPQPLHIQIPDARQRLLDGLHHYVGDKARWMPAYDEIADWLTDNKQRGLLCLGQCGLGKTLICSNIIPVLVNHYHRYIISTYSTREMNANIDTILRRKLIGIDDIGTEDDAVIYGQRRNAFAELVDEAEKDGKLLIITSNLPTTAPEGMPSLEARYGRRTLDRLRAVTRLVLFTGNSFRG